KQFYFGILLNRLIKKMEQFISIEVEVNAPREEVWANFTQPHHIVNWNHASKDWICTRAENNLKVNEKFSFGMAAKDGSLSFNMEGLYTELIQPQRIAYTLLDNRKVEIKFISIGNKTKIIQQFEPETTNSLQAQQQGW